MPEDSPAAASDPDSRLLVPTPRVFAPY
jgi:hypothetical protein